MYDNNEHETTIYEFHLFLIAVFSLSRIGSSVEQVRTQLFQKLYQLAEERSRLSQQLVGGEQGIFRWKPEDRLSANFITTMAAKLMSRYEESAQIASFYACPSFSKKNRVGFTL